MIFYSRATTVEPHSLLLSYHCILGHIINSQKHKTEERKSGWETQRDEFATELNKKEFRDANEVYRRENIQLQVGFTTPLPTT